MHFIKCQRQGLLSLPTKVHTPYARQTQDAIDRAANAMVPDLVSENRIKLENAQYLVDTAQRRVTVATGLEAATIELEAATQNWPKRKLNTMIRR